MKNNYAIQILQAHIKRLQHSIYKDEQSAKDSISKLNQAIEILKTADDYKCCGNCECYRGQHCYSEKIDSDFREDEKTVCKFWQSDGLKQSERMISEAQDED